jgi:hypothetical protein
MKENQKQRSSWQSRAGAVLAAVVLLGAGVASACPNPPHVGDAGCRYLVVTPVANPNRVAIQVIGLDGTPLGMEDVGCVSAYVQADGHLGPDPYYQWPKEWGTVYVFGPEVIPNGWYTARVKDEITEETSAAAESGYTWLWGDTDHDDDVDMDDIYCAVDVFQGTEEPPCTFWGADVWGSGTGCPPEQILNLDDIMRIIDAYQGGSFPCDKPCDERAAAEDSPTKPVSSDEASSDEEPAPTADK